MSEKLFTYRFSDGMEINREPTRATMLEIAEIEKQYGNKLIFNGFTDQLESLSLLRANSHKTKTDGFQPGWHPALGMEIRTNGQYQAELRARGMREVGNEKQVEKKRESKVFTDEIIKEAVDAGAQISGQEAEALTKGESLT